MSAPCGTVDKTIDGGWSRHRGRFENFVQHAAFTRPELLQLQRPCGRHVEICGRLAPDIRMHDASATVAEPLDASRLRASWTHGGWHFDIGQRAGWARGCQAS